MADIVETGPIAATPAVDPRKKRQDDRKAAYGRFQKAAGGATSRHLTTDQVSVMGIPARDLTPQVEEAITSLMEEVDQLRQELEHSREREEYLEEHADRDPLVPLISRRAFLRHLSLAISRGRQAGVPFALVYLDLANASEIKRLYGHRGLEGAMVHLALVFSSDLRRADVLGHLGCNAFGAILAGAGHTDAASKAATLVDAGRAYPFFWEGEEVVVRLQAGVHVVTSDDNVETALDAADRDSRRP